MKPRVEPLRGIGRRLLARQHVAHLVIEGARVFLAVEIAALPAPIGPCARQAIEHLLGGILARRAFAVRRLAPEKFRHAFLGHRLQRHRHACFSEIFLRQHIASDLAPAFGNFDVRLAEDDRAVGVFDLARCRAEGDAFVCAFAFNRELTPNPHGNPQTISKWLPLTLHRSLWGTVIRPPETRPSGESPDAQMIGSSARFCVAMSDRGQVWTPCLGECKGEVVNETLPTRCGGSPLQAFSLRNQCQEKAGRNRAENFFTIAATIR